MKNFLITTIAGFCLLVLASAAVAEARYVQDQLEITMRTGESTRNSIIRMLASGDRVELLESNPDSGYSKIRTSDGTEGWVLTRFLMSEPAARQQLANLRIRAATLREEQGRLETELEGVRDKNARLADPYSMTFLKPGFDEFSFSFPDTDGDMVSLSDPRFAGKVVLVTLAGTWCPNCHDEARYLADFYREYRDRGLEVVGLMYEHFEDFETAAEQVRRFRAELGIDYTLLVAGYSDKQRAAETLPMLNRVLAFPTTIFLGRNGEVRRIHTGFTGPGTGEYYDRFIAEFEDYVAGLVAETL